MTKPEGGSKQATIDLYDHWKDTANSWHSHSHLLQSWDFNKWAQSPEICESRDMLGICQLHGPSAENGNSGGEAHCILSSLTESTTLRHHCPAIALPLYFKRYFMISGPGLVTFRSWLRVQGDVANLLREAIPNNAAPSSLTNSSSSQLAAHSRLVRSTVKFLKGIFVVVRLFALWFGKSALILTACNAARLQV